MKIHKYRMGLFNIARYWYLLDRMACALRMSHQFVYSR